MAWKHHYRGCNLLWKEGWEQNLGPYWNSSDRSLLIQLVSPTQFRSVQCLVFMYSLEKNKVNSTKRNKTFGNSKWKEWRLCSIPKDSKDGGEAHPGSTLALDVKESVCSSRKEKEATG